jgi:hypothetical protein
MTGFGSAPTRLILDRMGDEQKRYKSFAPAWREEGGREAAEGDRQACV